MTSAAVEHLGHRCSVAVDGDEARRIFQAGDVEVLITDWEMPGMDGTALASRIRAEIGSGYTYIMLLTGRADEGSALATMLAGADDYATKPLTLADLKRKLVVAERVTTKHNGMHNDARQDPLTGLGNRWRLSEYLVALCGRVERYGHTYSLALIDTWWNSLSTNGSRMPRPARGPGTGRGGNVAASNIDGATSSMRHHQSGRVATRRLRPRRPTNGGSSSNSKTSPTLQRLRKPSCLGGSSAKSRS